MPDPTQPTQPTDSTDSTSRSESTAPADPTALEPGPALIISERQGFGFVSQELRADADDVLADGREIELSAGPAAEDRSDREILVLSLASGPVGGPGGFYVLSLAPAGGEPVVIRRADWLAGDQGGESSEPTVTAVIEARSPALEGRWGYSLRPRVRPVFLAADDDPSDGVEGSVLHVVDFDLDPVAPAMDDLGDGWTRLSYELPAWLIDQAPQADGCERVIDLLDTGIGAGSDSDSGSGSGSDELRWAERDLTEQALDRAASAVESELAAPGRAVNLTVEMAGREIVRGKRLQPLARYPITVVGDDGRPMAATLGCSISN
ncbi:MAG: hypothetical protein ACR2QK_00495 [Acidimicrobiales bacterium]